MPKPMPRLMPRPERRRGWGQTHAETDALVLRSNLSYAEILRFKHLLNFKLRLNVKLTIRLRIWFKLRLRLMLKLRFELPRLRAGDAEAEAEA